MNKHDAKYAFYYLLSLAALIFMAFSVGMVVFSIINKTIPDAINNYYSDIDGALKFAISALLIAAPIFYFVSHLIVNGLKKGELDKESALRRWLTYFILLVSSLIMLGVFIGVINSFLSGALTSHFILKAITVLVLSALPFSFYFYDIKRVNPQQADKVVRIFFFSTLILVLAAFIAAWFFVESPQTARNRRLDQTLLQNINNIEAAVNSYFDKYQKLPESLAVLQKDSTIYFDKRIFNDPETGATINYQLKDDRTFLLCATFRTSSQELDKGQPMFYADNSGNREHGSGYQCLPGNLYTNKIFEGQTMINTGLETSPVTPAVLTPAQPVIQ